jgi:shikimate dehydrogenase
MAPHVSQVTGSFSSPASRNLTSAMMRAAYAQLGYDVIHLNVEVSKLRLADAITGARAMGWLGFTIGSPHKVAAVANLDGLAESAAAIGSATVAARRGDALIGENTEGWAVIETAEEYLDLQGSRAVVLGTGGAARAVVVELARAGVSHITVVGRTIARARQLGGIVSATEGLTIDVVRWEHTFRVPPVTDILVNATSVGARGEVETQLDIDMDALTSQTAVIDMVVNPDDTQLVKQARAIGSPAVTGIDVAVQQGVLAVRLWTNADASPYVMRDALTPVLDGLLS